MSLKDYIIKSGKLPKKSTKSLAGRGTEIYNRAIKRKWAIVDEILKAKEQKEANSGQDQTKQDNKN